MKIVGEGMPRLTLPYVEKREDLGLEWTPLHISITQVHTETALLLIDSRRGQGRVMKIVGEGMPREGSPVTH